MLSFAFTTPAAQASLNDFTKRTGIKVAIDNIDSASFPSVLQTRVLGKADVDVINLRSGAEFNKYASSGTFTDQTGKSFLTNIDKGAISVGTVNNKTYGFAMGQYIISVVYNKSVFSKLGISVPTNWQEFIAAAKRIKDSGNGVAPVLISGGESWTNQYWYHNAIADWASKNPTFMSAVKSGTAKWSENSEFVKQISRVQDLGKQGLFIPGGETVKYNDAVSAFNAGKAAMWVMGSWCLDSLKPSGWDLGAFALPVNDDPGTPTTGASSLQDNMIAIPTWAKHPAEAQKLMEYMTTTDWGKTFQTSNSVKSTVAGVTGAPYSQYENVFDPLYANAHPFPANIAPSVNGSGPDLLGALLTGGGDPNAVVAGFQKLQDTDNTSGY